MENCDNEFIYSPYSDIRCNKRALERWMKKKTDKYPQRVYFNKYEGDEEWIIEFRGTHNNKNLWQVC